MTSNPAKPIFGYTDTETVKLDFDETSLSTAKYWADRLLSWYKLGGYIILKSSANSYHVLFDRTVSWSENMRIVAWVALLSRIESLKTWCLMQCIKESSTLRVSQKIEKPAPRIVRRYGRQNHEIANYLRYRKMTKKYSRELYSLMS